MPILGGLGRLAKFSLDPIRYLDGLFREHGRIAVLVRGRPTRVVSTERHVPGTVCLYGPELNRALFTDHEGFHKCALSGPLYPGEPFTARTQPLSRLLTGLFSVNGDEHRRHRRLLMPAFHKSRIESYRDDMVQLTDSLIEKLVPGEVRDVRPDMMELTLRVATKTLFGADMGTLGIDIGRDLQRWLELFGPSTILPLDLPGLPYRRWLDICRSIDRRMSDVITAKRQSGRGGKDMLSMLLEATDEAGDPLTDDQLVGHAGVIFAAGHETSSNGLCWTLFLLAQHPRFAAELVGELDSVLRGRAPTVDDLPSLRLLDFTIKESMRLIPPVPLNHRIVARDCSLGGYTLPAGTEVLSSAYHTHRMPELYPEPLRFQPERWSDREAPGPYAYSPFGAGPRMCIGATFALMEMKIVLAMLLQRFRFELVPGTRIDRFLTITLAPKPGLPLLVRAQDRDFRAPPATVRGSVRELYELPPN